MCLTNTYLGTDKDISSPNRSSDTKQYKIDVDLLHRRLAHLNISDVKKFAKENDIVLTGNQRDLCPACVIGKMTQTSVPKAKLYRAILPFATVHTDLLSSSQPSLLYRHIASVVYIDDYSRACKRLYIRSKTEVPSTFQSFLTFAVMRKGFRTTLLMCDRGGEYYGQMDSFCSENGIQIRRCPTARHELNGVAERRNRTHADKTRALLINACRPAGYWEFAMRTVEYLDFISPCNANPSSKSPFEVLEQSKPTVIPYLKVWGAPVYVLNHRRTGKFTPKSKVGIFVGYSLDGPGYQVYFPQSRVLLRGVIDIVVDESFAAPGMIPTNSIRFGSDYENLFIIGEDSSSESPSVEVQSNPQAVSDMRDSSRGHDE